MGKKIDVAAGCAAAIEALAKLYPWEWMTADEFGLNLRTTDIKLVEPAWKMLLSNKAILPVLWEMFPGHPNLLAASFEPGRFSSDYVKNGREHNDSNVLTLGARLLTQTQAEDVLRTWLETPFAGGRHQARVQKIMDIEQQYSRKASS